MIHCLGDLRDLDQPCDGLMSIHWDQLHAHRELLEVILLRRTQWILLKEGNDRLYQFHAPIHDVLTKVLAMVVVPPIDVQSTDSKESAEILETSAAALTLRHDKPVRHLISGSVTSAPCPVWLPDEADGEASFSVYKTENPAEPDQSFLLIFRTRHVVTMVNVTLDVTR
jgi:hypothetical protein